MSKENRTNNVSREAAMRQNMFFRRSETYGLVAGDHNIGEVLPGSDQGTLEYIDKTYRQRGWHIPKPTKEALLPDPATGRPRTRMGLVVANSTEDVRANIDYIRAMTGLPIEEIRPNELKDEASLVVPYIRTAQANERLTQLGAETWGLPPEMTNIMKSKVEFHNLLDNEYQSETFRVADYTVSDVENVTQASMKFLKTVENIYQDVGLSKNYKDKMGIVLRASESDGNYGNCIVRVDNGDVIVIEDGQTKAAKRIKGTGQAQWAEAFAKAQSYLESTMNQQFEKRVVISRMADIVDSPGMTASIIDGHVLSWGWNGQLMLPGSKACVGTSSYEPESRYLQNIQKEFEEQSGEDFEKFLKWFAQKQNVHFEEIAAFANIDLMIPSKLEFELQKRRGQKRHLLLAESNPRLSEFSDSVVGSTLFFPTEQTTETFKTLNRNGVYTYAKYPLPDGVDPRNVRNELYDQYREREQKELVVVRMAQTPSYDDPEYHPTMGVVIFGDKEKGERSIKKAVKTVFEAK